MTWFRLSDDLHDHDKTMDLESGPCFDSAISLWARAASWSSKNAKRGFVSHGAAKALAKHPEAPSELVRVGFWDPAEGGYQFRNWAKYNPSAEERAAKRQAETVRKARYRAKLADESQNQTSLQLDEPIAKVAQCSHVHAGQRGQNDPCPRGTPGYMGEEISSSSGSEEQAACQVVDLNRDQRSASIAGYRWLDDWLGGGGQASSLEANKKLYAEIGRKPVRERVLVAKHLSESHWVVEDRKRAKPRHIIAYWDEYLAGPRNFGTKPLARRAAFSPCRPSQDHESDDAGARLMNWEAVQ